MNNTKVIPLIGLKGIVMFPNNTLSFEIVGKKAVETVQKAFDNGGYAFMATRKSSSEDKNEIFDIGTISLIRKIFPLGLDRVQIVAQGETKAKLCSEVQKDGFIEVTVEEIERTYVGGNEKMEGLIMAVKSAFDTYLSSGAKILPETAKLIMAITDPIALTDMIASNLLVNYIKKQELLELDDFEQKLETITELIFDRSKALIIQNEIVNKAKEKIEKSQKDYYLKEQSKVINEELGDASNVSTDIEEYEKRAKELKLTGEPLEKLQKELKRLRRSGGFNQEGAIVRDYIEYLLNTPWSEKTEENPDLAKAEFILNSDHYGLFKVKERIMEFLCVKKSTNNLDSPIICLVGPPGVGKTSIAKSVAKALNRKYARISLGGVRDEAEIRGHRRTYVGSMPGRIIATLSQSKSTNPLILLDEIDKLSSDYKGDPSSALLEVLDAEQNKTFRDHYLEINYDLSDVFFMCTANSLDNIPAPLRDRLEIIEISSYTLNDKEHIAKEFLIEKQKKKNGIPNIFFTDKAVAGMIKGFTREAGVRQLERQIAKVCRKALKDSLMGKSVLINSNSNHKANAHENALLAIDSFNESNNEEFEIDTDNMFTNLENYIEAIPSNNDEPKAKILITDENLNDYLGMPKFKQKHLLKENPCGVVTGLAWTSLGGQTLLIEVNILDGKGKLQLTGNLGDVMKESAMAAISFIRSKAEELSVDPEFYKNKDIHIHIPEGATPKDGPSAGITLCTALISALAKKQISPTIAMTGEVTLTGRVLPIGGLKEKILGGKAFGINKILIPIDNESDLVEIEKEVKEGITIIPVSNMIEVLSEAFN